MVRRVCHDGPVSIDLLYALAAIFAVLAGLLHGYIWYLESYAWTTRARGVFGTTREQAEATKEMAFNQGYYNLFAGIFAILGAYHLVTDRHEAGTALVFAACGTMLGAAIVLVAGNRSRLRPALIQGTLPALALLFVVLANA